MTVFGAASGAILKMLGKHRRGLHGGLLEQGRKQRRLSMKVGAGAQLLDETPLRVGAPKLSVDVGIVLRFVVPGLGTALLAPMMDATAAAVTGRFGSVMDLAALSPAIASCDMVGLLFLFLSATTANRLSMARGRQDYKSARDFLADSCCLAICCGLAASLLMLLNSHSVLRMLISPAALAHTLAPAAAYIHIRAFAYPVQMLQLVLSAACFSALQDTVTPLRATAAGGIVSLVLDLVLIAGFGLGTTGAAMATACGQLVAVALLVRKLRNNRGFGTSEDGTSATEALPLLTSPRKWLHSLNPARMFPLIAFAAPFLSFQLMQVMLMSFETRMGSEFGAMSLAAHQITYSIWRPLISLGDPIMQAALAFVPAHLIEGSIAGRVRARSLARAILVVAAGIGVVSGAVGYALCAHLPFIFTAHTAVAKEAAGLALPMVASVATLSIWHCNQGLMLATGRARLLAALYSWNVFYFVAGSCFVLRSGLTLFHSWWVWASMHAIFSLIISVVLRMRGGVLARVDT